MGEVQRTGALSFGDCVVEVSGVDRWADVYTFSLQRSTNVQIDLVNVGSRDANPYLILSSASGGTLARDDDGGPGNSARISRVLDAGTYRVTATKRRSGEGSYRITLAATTQGGPGVEPPPPTACAPTDLGYPGTQIVERVGNLGRGDCDAIVNGHSQWADQYTFSLTEWRVVWIDLENVDGIDPYLILRTDSGNVLENDDDHGESRNASIGHTLGPGRYRIDATQYSNASGSYRLRISSGPVGAQSCVWNDMGTLWTEVQRWGELGDGDCVTLVNGANSWADVYMFNLSRRTRVTIVLANAARINPYLILRSSDGTELATGDSGAGGSGAWIDRMLNAGSYRIEATKRRLRGGNYHLTVTPYP